MKLFGLRESLASRGQGASCGHRRLFLGFALAFMAFGATLPFPENAGCEQVKTSYEFRRMWPRHEQPWYFNYPTGAAMDGNGDFYVVDSRDCLIQKFSPEGKLITQWRIGSQPAIAADGSGNIYIFDYFSRNGGSLGERGRLGTGPRARGG